MTIVCWGISLFAHFPFWAGICSVFTSPAVCSGPRPALSMPANVGTVVVHPFSPTRDGNGTSTRVDRPWIVTTSPSSVRVQGGKDAWAFFTLLLPWVELAWGELRLEC